MTHLYLWCAGGVHRNILPEMQEEVLTMPLRSGPYRECSCFVDMCVTISFYTLVHDFMSDTNVLGSWYVFILAIVKV